MVLDIFKKANPSMNESVEKLEYSYLSSLIKNTTLVSVYLINGIKLSGIIVENDLSVILLRDTNNTTEQLIYKHAVSTIVPKLESKNR